MGILYPEKVFKDIFFFFSPHQWVDRCQPCSLFPSVLPGIISSPTLSSSLSGPRLLPPDLHQDRSQDQWPVILTSHNKSWEIYFLFDNIRPSAHFEIQLMCGSAVQMHDEFQNDRMNQSNLGSALVIFHYLVVVLVIRQAKSKQAKSKLIFKSEIHMVLLFFPLWY